MNARSTAALAIALASLMGAPPALAQDGKADAEATQRSMEDAQRKLEEAAREIARLSGETGGLMKHVFKMRMPPAGRAVLGVNIESAAPGTDGVRVVSVSPGGPAAEAGVKAGDLIVGVNGQKIAAGRELIERMAEVKAGDTVALDLRRDSKPVAVSVATRAAADLPRELDFDIEDLALQGLHGLPGMADHSGMPMGGHFLLGPWGDAEFVTLTPALGRYFGTDRGLLVVRSPTAAATELEEGDVILSIGGREPQNGGHALRILRSYQSGEIVDLKVLRQKKERTVRIVVPAAPGHAGRRVIIKREGPPEAGADGQHVIIEREGPADGMQDGRRIIIRKEVPKAAAPEAPPKTGG